MKAALFLILALTSASAHAGALGELCRQSGGSDCDAPKTVVHPAGWIVDANCLNDQRWTAGELRLAFNLAAKKFAADVPVSQGGCLSEYNPSWAKELTTFLHANPVHVTCPSYDPKEKFCADYTKSATSGGTLRLLNAGACVDGAKIEGLASTIFHEPLHADGADSLPTEKHNKAGELPQYAFVTDRVYGTEALCFSGMNPKTRKQVNILQCRTAVNYLNDSPKKALCEGFNTSFYDTIPPSTIK